MPVGLGLMLLTFFGLLVAGIVFVAALRARNSTLLVGVLTVTVVWLATYMVVLLAVSLQSQEKVLGFNQVKPFCGFYLDCDLHVTVTDATTSKTLPGVPSASPAQGEYYLVTMKIISDAKRETITPYELIARVLGDSGQVITRDTQAEAALEKASGKSIPMEQSVAAGQSYTKTLVFDVPTSVTNPKLFITEGLWIDRALETFLIGDEDSLMHAHTVFRLEPGT
jgi:hypothetical protein